MMLVIIGVAAGDDEPENGSAYPGVLILTSPPPTDVRKPDVVVPLSFDASGARISADGTLIYYAPYDIETLHFGRLIGQWLRELALFIAIMTCWPGAWLAWRARRRRRVKGALYCRKCNYELTGNTSGQCPECGVNLHKKRPVRGGATLMRSLRLGCIIAIVGTFLAAVHVNKDQIGQWMEENVRWHSVAIMEWANKNEIELLMKASEPHSTLRAVDVMTGKHRFLFDVSLEESMWDPVILSADGRRVVTMLVDEEGEGWLGVWEATTGRFINRIAPPEGFNQRVYGVSTDGREVYVGRWIEDEGVGEWRDETPVYAVDTKTGHTRLAVAIPLYLWIIDDDLRGATMNSRADMIAAWEDHRLHATRISRGEASVNLELPSDEMSYRKVRLSADAVSFVIDGYADSADNEYYQKTVAVHTVDFRSGNRTRILRAARSGEAVNGDSENYQFIRDFWLDDTGKFVFLYITDSVAGERRAYIDVWSDAEKRYIVRLDVNDTAGPSAYSRFRLAGTKLVAMFYYTRAMNLPVEEQVQVFDLADVLNGRTD